MSSGILAPPPIQSWPPQTAAARNAPDTTTTKVQCYVYAISVDRLDIRAANYIFFIYCKMSGIE